MRGTKPGPAPVIANRIDHLVKKQIAKTATLQEFHRALNESGREVIAVAPTMSAVEELHKVGFQEAMTVQRLLQDEEAQATLSGKVIIADEAGMISGRQMSDLLKVAEGQGARLVFSGDTRQIRSAEATDALRVLEDDQLLIACH